MRPSVRRDLVPASAVPLAYFALAHAGLALALAVLAVAPGVIGASFYHPRAVALVHLVTIAWLTGCILGAFYIVGPLALRLPMPAGRGDWVAFGTFAAGAAGMIGHFWIGEYDGMAWSGGMVAAAIGWVGVRALRGLRTAVVPWPVKLHVALAFVNITIAAGFGILIGLDRSRGFLSLSPLSATYAHAHLAGVGWVTMMVVGLSYRLIPMILPAVMPTGRSLAWSAVFIEAGLLVLVTALLMESGALPIGGLLIAAGLVSFVAHIRQTVKRRLPRPPGLPARDWSTWQTHAAFLWLLVALGLGLAATFGFPASWRLQLTWIYGVAGLIGFLTQIVVGIQGRLVPFYAWYRAFAALDGAPPPRAASELPSAPFARFIFFAWTAGVPALAWGLSCGSAAGVSIGALALLIGVCAGGGYLAYMLRKAKGGIRGQSAHEPLREDAASESRG